MNDFSRIFLYRMTHIENIPHILQRGITHISSPNVNNNYVPIGDGSLIARRDAFSVGNGRMLGSYIPFYFGTRMPMLYVIQNGYNGVNAISPKDIIYCVVSVEQILNYNLEYVYTDGHAVESISTFFFPRDIDNIETNIDREAINSKFWKDEDDLDKKRRKEAEFLVGNDIPHNAILGYAVYDVAAKAKLVEFGVPEKMIAIRNEYYF